MAELTAATNTWVGRVERTTNPTPSLIDTLYALGRRIRIRLLPALNGPQNVQMMEALDLLGALDPAFNMLEDTLNQKARARGGLPVPEDILRRVLGTTDQPQNVANVHPAAAVIDAPPALQDLKTKLTCYKVLRTFIRLRREKRSCSATLGSQKHHPWLGDLRSQRKSSSTT